MPIIRIKVFMLPALFHGLLAGGVAQKCSAVERRLRDTPQAVQRMGSQQPPSPPPPGMLPHSGVLKVSFSLRGKEVSG